MNSPIPSVEHPPAVDGGPPRLRRGASLARVWQRLSPRLARSAEQARFNVTSRAADMRCETGPDGLVLHIAYDIGNAAALPGEPTRICLVDVPAGGPLELAVDATADSAWLVIDGEAQIGGVRCAALDYQQRSAGDSRVGLSSAHGARLMLREARPGAPRPDGASAVHTTPASQMVWQPLGDGISRRLLAPPQGAAAAYLVRMAAGAAAPAHRHGHAEECLLLSGEMYLDDVLLFGGDFQLARAGGLHHEASSAHGVLLVVHGDLDLDVVSPDPH